MRSFDGLNLTWETLEGLVKHNGPLLTVGDGKRRRKARPFRNRSSPIVRSRTLSLRPTPRVEAQIAALADDIAYNNHDIDDGYRAGLFTFDELAEVPLAGRALADVRRRLIPASTDAPAALRGEPPPDHRHDRGCGRGDGSCGSIGLRPQNADEVRACRIRGRRLFAKPCSSELGGLAGVPCRARLSASPHRAAS